MELKGKTALVTGAGRGIGQTLALEFGRQGCNVVCCSRHQDEIEQTAKLIREEGHRALALVVDVTSPKQVKKMVEKAIKKFGRIDILFNNAGSFQAIGGLWEVDPELWWHDVTVNLRGVMLCCQAVLPYMMAQDEGIIINMNGGGSTVPLPGGSGYGCSKAAVMRLTDTLARELEKAGSHILVFGMGPGLVRTKMTEWQVKTEAGRKWIPSTEQAFQEGRYRQPEECARATMELIRIACPELNGRNFGVGMDFEDIRRRAAEIKEKDLLVLRSR